MNTKGQLCRSRRDWRKEKALTRGYLVNHGLVTAMESAEAIVAIGNEPSKRWRTHRVVKG